MNDSSSTTLSAQDAPVKVVGRTEITDTGGRRFGYPGVSLELAITGGDLSMTAFSTSDVSYLTVQVDDLPARTIKLSTDPRSIMLVADDGKRHQVRVSHRSETWHGVVTVEGFTLTKGAFLPAPPPRPHRLLIIGDSVTCGEAVERTADCKKDTRWWNPDQSYGMRLARALDADAHLVCYGGRGLTRSWDGSTADLQAPAFFEMTIPEKGMPEWDHKAFDPELILISLGTNDFNLDIGPLPEKETFVTTYVRFVERLLEQHPRAQIVLTEGAIVNDGADPQRPQKTVLRNYIAETLARVEDPRVHQVPSTNYPGDECDGHPTKAQHGAMAEDLIPPLRRIMGW